MSSIIHDYIVLIQLNLYSAVFLIVHDVVLSSKLWRVDLLVSSP